MGNWGWVEWVREGGEEWNWRRAGGVGDDGVRGREGEPNERRWGVGVGVELFT